MNLNYTRLFLAVFFSLLFTVANAQVPQQFNYQAVIRNGSGQPLVNKTVKLRLAVNAGGVAGLPEYVETRTLTTNEFGLVSVAVGSAGADAIQGTMAGVSWSSGNRHLRVEVDHDNDGSFTLMGNTPIVSTPYALYASPLGNAGGDLGDKFPNPTIQKLQGQALDMSGTKYDGYTLKWNAAQNKWMPKKDEDGGPDYYFRATRNSHQGVAIKAAPGGNYYHFINQFYPTILKTYSTLLRFPREETDAYSVFNDSVFTAPVAGFYEFEINLRFHQFFYDPANDDPLAESKLENEIQLWLGFVKNANENSGFIVEYYKNNEHAELKPMHYKRVLYLQAGETIKARIAHNKEYKEMVLGYVEPVSGNATNDYNYINWEALTFSGRKLR